MIFQNVVCFTGGKVDSGVGGHSIVVQKEKGVLAR